MRMMAYTMISLVLISLLSTGTALADAGDYYDHMDGDHMDGQHMMGLWGSWWGGFWMVVMLIILILIAIWLYYALVKDAREPARYNPSTADLVLDERYARGELDTEEYLRMKTLIIRSR